MRSIEIIDLSIDLAKLAIHHGVRRFVYLSSIKVNGEYTSDDTRFTPDDGFSNVDPYAISKYEAERGLLKLIPHSDFEVVIVRPPMVYGPNVKANFAILLRWINRGLPLPFGSVNNKRSFIALDNLVDFISLCADRVKSPQAANQIFLLSDNEDVSTTMLLRKVADAYGVNIRLLSVPVSLMQFAARMLGKSHISNRLFGNLQVDATKAHDLLGWRPIITMNEQLNKMAMFEKRGDDC